MKRRVPGRSGLSVSEICLGTAVLGGTPGEAVGSTVIGVTRVEQLDELLAGAGFAIPDRALAACDRIAKEIRYPME